MGRARAGEGEAPTETSGRARGVLVAADVEEEDGVVQVEPPLAEEVEGEERHVVEAHGDDGPVLRRPRRGEVEAQVKEVEGRGQPRPPPAGARDLALKSDPADGDAVVPARRLDHHDAGDSYPRVQAHGARAVVGNRQCRVDGKHLGEPLERAELVESVEGAVQQVGRGQAVHLQVDASDALAQPQRRDDRVVEGLGEAVLERAHRPLELLVQRKDSARILLGPHAVESSYQLGVNADRLADEA